MSASGEPACGGSCGITRERDRQKQSARALVESVFAQGSERTLRKLPDEEPFALDEPTRLAEAMASALPCRALVVSGERANWIYLVATVAERTWLGVRELGEHPPAVAHEGGVRVGLSSLGRFATLQEIALHGSIEPGGYWIEERRCAGIEDRRLQTFVKATQGILRRQKVASLDAVFLSEALTGHDTTEAFTLWNGIFDSEPMHTTVGTFIPAG